MNRILEPEFESGGGMLADLFYLTFGKGRFNQFFIESTKDKGVAFGTFGVIMILPEEWCGPALKLIKSGQGKIPMITGHIEPSGNWALSEDQVNWRSIVGKTYGKKPPKLGKAINLVSLEQHNRSNNELEKISTIIENNISDKTMLLYHDKDFGDLVYHCTGKFENTAQPTTVFFNAAIVHFLYTHKFKIHSNTVNPNGVFPLSLDGKKIRGFIGPMTPIVD